MAAHGEFLSRAISAEAAAQRAALERDAVAAAESFMEAAALYRASWEDAPPRAFGRLVGHLKAAVQAGSGPVEARYVLGQITAPDSPPSWYAVAIAALVLGDDARAVEAAAGMRVGVEGPGGASSGAFERVADAVEALAGDDAPGYAAAVRAIVADFEAREDHLTGVPFADTAAVLERIAQERGLRAGVSSPLLPPAPAGGA